MPDRKEINKRGYLKEDFRLFHLKDSRAQQIGYHYHEFDKVILLLGGKVTYVVEGVTYFLQPWDLLLVPHDRIHRPIIDPSEPYERVVIWLGREWLERRSDPGEALDTCFDTTRERGRRRWMPASRRRCAGTSTFCASRRRTGLPTSNSSRAWRAPSAPRTSATGRWRTFSASSCC